MRKRKRTEADVLGELPSVHALVILKLMVQNILECQRCKTITFEMVNGQEIVLIESICRDHNGGRILRQMAHQLERAFKSS